MPEDYWNAAFAQECERIEPSLYESIARAGYRIAHQGLFPMLRTLAPQIRIDPGRRTLRLDRPHDHDITVTHEHPVTFTAGHYVWPHVRVTCDSPWPLRITHPALPLAPPAHPGRTRHDPARGLYVLYTLAPDRLDQIVTALLTLAPRPEV
ncbi:hypothetical protein EF912_02365 [Streptomyces sp. WAC07061]|nr:hypothetical protein EF912_02365 [Streptomyces sp. WAC07061]